MNNGQQKFFEYMMSCIDSENVQMVQEMLKENFVKQQNNTFTKEDALNFIDKVLPLAKPEKVEELQKIMTTFVSQFK